MANSERKKQQKREKKNRKRKIAKKRGTASTQNNKANERHALKTVLPRLATLCNGVSPTVITLAANEELSPEEIATRIGITADEAEAIVAEFLKLPDGVANKLVQYPEILNNPDLMDLMINMDASKAQSLLGRLNN